jgi:hypothetical protein
MKEDDPKNINQKQMLLNRLYKSNNNPSANKNITKPEDAKLLFYVISLIIFNSKLKKK